MKTRIYILLISIILIMLYIGCAAHTNLQPVGKGEWQGNVSYGGPIIKVFGLNMPTPWPVLGSRYGLRDDLDFDANLHILPLPYGITGFDLGSTWYPIIGDGRTPTVGIQPRIMTFMSVKEGVEERFRFVPILTGSAAWQHRKNSVYTGMNLVIPTTRPDYDEDASFYMTSPFAGYRWALGNRFKLYTEIKWQGANIRSDQLAVTYTGIAGYGAIAPLIALEWNF
ncbi:MAG: hypothetical protein P9L92_19105 [Candidatus Electryonea clarkiae]|nr:hypothetical protein [Candidatus Electryonea clarkiae]MDP8285560.1 hypothetical protein [Candidatus Electryonea clarkiae]